MKRDAAPRVEVRVTQRCGAPAERVFDAWIDPVVAGQWLFASASRPAERVVIVRLDTGCELALTQEKVPPDQARRIEGRWSGMLYGLDVLLADASIPIHE